MHFLLTTTQTLLPPPRTAQQ